MEQLENAEAYLAQDADKKHSLPPELLEQAKERIYDSFSDLSVMHRRFISCGNRNPIPRVGV